MAIEFNCTECNRLLQSADIAAGHKVACPGCGTLLIAPAGDLPIPAGGQRSKSQTGKRVTFGISTVCLVIAVVLWLSSGGKTTEAGLRATCRR